MITCERRAGAASRTARCIPPRRCSLAATALKAIKDRNHLDPHRRRRRRHGLRRSGRRSGRRHRADGRARRGLRRHRAGRADQSLLRLRPRLGQFRRRAGDERPARHDDRRRRRIDEPRRHRRVRRRVAGRSFARDSRLFHAAGRLGRPDRDQVWLLARRRRRLRGRVAEAGGGSLEGGPVQELDRAGPRRQRPAAARPRRAHAAEHRHAVAGFAQALVRHPRRAGRLRRGRHSGPSGGRAHHPCPSRRQFVGHRRRRRGGASGFARGRGEGWPQAARRGSAPSPISVRSRRSC